MGKKLKTEFKELENPYNSNHKCIQPHCDGQMFTDKTLIRENSKGNFNIRWLCNKCHVQLDGTDYEKDVMPEIITYLAT